MPGTLNNHVSNYVDISITRCSACFCTGTGTTSSSAQQNSKNDCEGSHDRGGCDGHNPAVARVLVIMPRTITKTKYNRCKDRKNNDGK